MLHIGGTEKVVSDFEGVMVTAVYRDLLGNVSAGALHVTDHSDHITPACKDLDITGPMHSTVLPTIRPSLESIYEIQFRRLQ